MRRPLALALCLIAASAIAGYEKTQWGMSLAQVKALYPGGEAETEQDGSVEYSVVKPFHGQSPALVTFYFPAEGGLSRVDVVCPRSGTAVDLKTGSFDATTADEAATIHANLLKALTKTYGKPSATSGETTGWFTKAGDFVSLKDARHDPNQVVVTVIHQKWSAGRPKP